MSTASRKQGKPDPVRARLLAWLARYLHTTPRKVQLRFCTDKNTCFHKTFKRMARRPKYYVLCTSQGNCTMQSHTRQTVDLTYIDLPDGDDDE